MPIEHCQRHERLSKKKIHRKGQTMKHHIMKILPEFFQPVQDRTKTFEIRLNDRDYRTGDTVELREYDSDRPESERLTGRTYVATIGFLTEFAQKPGYVVFSLLPMELA